MRLLLLFIYARWNSVACVVYTVEFCEYMHINKYDGHWSFSLLLVIPCRAGFKGPGLPTKPLIFHFSQLRMIRNFFSDSSTIVNAVDTQQCIFLIQRHFTVSNLVTAL